MTLFADLSSSFVGLKSLALQSELSLQLRSAHTVSLAKSVRFSVTILRTIEKVLSLEAFECGMHRRLFINLLILLKMNWPADFFFPIHPQNLSMVLSFGRSSSSCSWYSRNSSRSTSVSRSSWGNAWDNLTTASGETSCLLSGWLAPHTVSWDISKS